MNGEGGVWMLGERQKIYKYAEVVLILHMIVNSENGINIDLPYSINLYTLHIVSNKDAAYTQIHKNIYLCIHKHTYIYIDAHLLFIH